MKGYIQAVHSFKRKAQLSHKAVRYNTTSGTNGHGSGNDSPLRDTLSSNKSREVEEKKADEDDGGEEERHVSEQEHSKGSQDKSLLREGSEKC